MGTSIRVEVLGPLRVWRHRSPVRITGRRQRLLLSVLVAEHRRTVPVDRLIDALWDDAECPLDPQNTLQQYIAHLRRALDAAPGPTATTLVTSPPGYRLELPVGGLDLDELDHFVRRARTALADGGSADARDFGLRGLDLWIGEPFEEFAVHPFLLAAVERARFLNHAALEVVADVHRAAGDAATVVDLLETRPGSWRQRGPLAVALVWALAAEGRPADALARAEEHRRAAAERGVEPGATLRRLVAEVLAHGRARTPLRPTPPASPEAGALRHLVTTLPGTEGEAAGGEWLAHHLALARAMSLPTFVADSATWRTELARRRPGFDRALRWARAEDPATGLDLAVELARFWDWTGDLDSLRSWFPALLEALPADAEAPRSDAHGWLAFAWRDDPERSNSHLVAAEVAAREPDELGRVHAVRSVVLRSSDPAGALVAAEEAIDILLRHGSHDEAGYAYVVAALAALALGREDEAHAHAASAAGLYTDVHHPSGLAWVDVIEARIAGTVPERAVDFERRQGDRSVAAMLDPPGAVSP